MKRNVLLFIAIITVATFCHQALCESILKQAIAHIPDQSYRESNDPKNISMNRTFGQTFTPKQTKLSFLRIKAFRIKGKDTKNSLGLDLRMWQCDSDYKKTKKQLPVYSNTKALEFGNSVYFRADTDLSLDQVYYWELSAPLDPTPYWMIRYQYGNSKYENGDFVINGTRWGNSDFDFTTYYPVELQPNKTLKEIPEIFEVIFNTDMDTEKTRLEIKNSSGQFGKYHFNWDNKKKITVFLNSPSLETSKEEFSLAVYATTKSGENENFEIPFTVSNEKMPSTVSESNSANKLTVNNVCPIVQSDAEQLIRGIVRASVNNVKRDNDTCEFSITAHVEPIIAMQAGHDQIDIATLNKFRDHNINAVSLFLPNFLEKPEILEDVKNNINLMHQKGFLIFWLVETTPTGYDPEILDNKKNIHKIDWNGKVLKRYCHNNPFVREAFISNYKKYLNKLKESGVFLDAIIVNEPGRKAGEFCYCENCKKLFEKSYNASMPLPVNLATSKSIIPVEWRPGLPKEKHMKPGDKKLWQNMSDFYCQPITIRVQDIFKLIRPVFPKISCQVTTITDIAPYYGIDFFNGIMNLEDLDGVQTAIYWGLGGHSPKTVGARGIALNFVKKAEERNLSCYYWLQGYDAGDHSHPLKPGEITIAVKEAFNKGVDGILIWSYLNPILGPWNKPYHWPEYFVELRDAVKPQLIKHKITQKLVLKNEKKGKFMLKNDGMIFNVEAVLENTDTLNLTVKSKAYHTFNKKININLNP